MQYPYIRSPYQYWGYNSRDVQNNMEIRKPVFKDFFNIGDKAPDFTLSAVVNLQPTRISLSDYVGKWVVLFFYGSNFTYV
jgi:hypothetical protein